MAERPIVFISYSHGDDRRADEIAAALELQGTPVETDKTMAEHGANWIERLEDALARCDLFMPLISKRYLESKIAAYELGFVLRGQVEGKPRIIPVILDDAGLSPMTGGLARFTALDGRGMRGSEIVKAVFDELKPLGSDDGRIPLSDVGVAPP